ncbi:HPr kinase/phosphatase C-terminal domain-containing protein [Hyphomicrobium sp.]|uniref:HPr kinase/phosphorylase n=1 Tax=Hyphomicrobium sp. TaxID=82 RepID=UPI002D799E77|nr:HPr kinase/phosphatase C-terminal domain-containing protein [Hyphomicrobium sp.]HET6388622.1 HPr kinase/phosphatase C-terminal domain-containing protein [Hyphomicrobium sp.]
MPGELDRVHATAIAVGGRAALIRGASGSGKSDLAFRCLGLGLSAIVPDRVMLVSDDQVLLRREGSSLRASAPPQLRGKIEVRGIGILDVDAVTEANVVLVADLVHEGAIERFPDPWPCAQIMGVAIPQLRLRPFESSSALKLVAAIQSAAQPRSEPKA